MADWKSTADSLRKNLAGTLAPPATNGGVNYARPVLGPKVQGTTLKVYEFVKAQPGTCIQEVADALQVERNAVSYHLHRLGRLGLIAKLRQGRRLGLFPAGLRDSASMEALAVMRLKVVRQLVDELLANPKISWRALALKLQRTPCAIKWQVKRLNRLGLAAVLRHPDGGHEVNFSPALTTTLQKPMNGGLTQESGVPTPPESQALGDAGPLW